MYVNRDAGSPDTQDWRHAVRGEPAATIPGISSSMVWFAHKLISGPPGFGLVVGSGMEVGTSPGAFWCHQRPFGKGATAITSENAVLLPKCLDPTAEH